MIYDENTIAAKYLIKTAYIVRVVDVHPERQTVDVMQDSFEFTTVSGGSYAIINEFGVVVPAESLAPFFVNDVPVQQLRWGKFSIQCMPQVNDTGLLVVTTDDIQRWKEEGGASAAGSGAKFSVDSSVFLPFVANQTNIIEDFPSPDTELVIKSENVSIKLTDNGTDANIAIEGDTTIRGDVSIEGKLTVSGVISSDEDVKVGEVSLKDHTHTVQPNGIIVNPQTGKNDAPIIIPKP